MGNEDFGVEILKVKEIIGYQEVTEVPQTPTEVKGVINLRGQVIPVVDLRLRFGMEEKEITEDDARRAEDDIQKLTDKFIGEVEKLLENCGFVDIKLSRKGEKMDCLVEARKEG